MIKEALIKKLEGDVALSEANLRTFLEKSIGFARRPGMAVLCFLIVSSWRLSPIQWTAFLSTAPCRSQIYVRSFPSLKLLLERNGLEAHCISNRRATLTQAVSS